MLTKDEIRAVKDSRVESVDVPEWDGTVFVRTLTSGERDRFESQNVRIEGRTARAELTNVRARFAVLVCSDEHGKRLFDDSDVDWLSGKSAKPLDRIWEAGNRLNAMRESDMAEAEGKSEAAAVNGSGTS